MELVAWIIGGLCALVVLRNKKTWEGGIGPNTIRALTIVLGVPLILTLSAQKILEGQTVGAGAPSFAFFAKGGYDDGIHNG